MSNNLFLYGPNIERSNWWVRKKHSKLTEFNCRLCWRKLTVDNWLDAYFGGATND